MLFARLLESQRAAVATHAMFEGAGVSALVHGLLIGGYLFMTRDVAHVRPEPDDTFTPVQWLGPKDPLPGRPQPGTGTWATLPERMGGGVADDPQGEPRGRRRRGGGAPAGKAAGTG